MRANSVTCEEADHHVATGFENSVQVPVELHQGPLLQRTVRLYRGTHQGISGHG